MEAIPLWLLPEHFWQSVAVLRPCGLAGQPRSTREDLGKAVHCAFQTQKYNTSIPAYESCHNHAFSSHMAVSLHRAAKFARYRSPKRKIAASPGHSNGPTLDSSVRLSVAGIHVT